MIEQSSVTRRAAMWGVAAIGLSLRPSILCGIDPVARNGRAKFKFSLAAYSYRSLLTGDRPALTLSDFVADCAEFGLDGTELTSYYFPKSVTHDDLRGIKKRCFELGLDISGTAVGNDFGHPEGEKRRAEIQSVKNWVDFAHVLGAPCIRVFAGNSKPGISEATTHTLMVSGLEECCEYAGKQGIFLALENHGGPTATADGLLRFVRDVKSPWFGVNLDTGNFASDEVYRDLAKVTPYALNVQVKVKYSKLDKSRHDTDYGKLAGLLKDASYRGYVVLEFEEEGDVRTECKKHLDLMREAFSKVT